MRTSLTVLALAGSLTLVACDNETDHPAPTRTPAPSVQTVPPPIDRTQTTLGTPATQPANRDADNTGLNVRDRAENAPTAGMTGQSKEEVNLASTIRKRLTDTELSVNAQNAKIVVQGNQVILRGPVKSAEEKAAVGRIAAEIAGEANVDNQLEIEANP